MAIDTERRLKLDVYKSDEKPTWCPGCGDFGVLNAVYNAMLTQGYDPAKTVVVSGIGCSSRLPFFSSTYGFHSVHGRLMPVATGVRLSNPELNVIAVGGDGDAFAIGGNHFIHAARRNLNVCYVIMDNNIYGLTKGQVSPTSSIGFVTKTTPKGNPDQPVNPLMLALAAGATFIARAFSGRPKELADMVVQGMQHRGFAVIDAYSPCPTFNKINTFQFYRDGTAPLPKEYDPTDRTSALPYLESENPYYLGVLYKRDGESFLDHMIHQVTGTEADREKVLQSALARFE